MPATTSWDLGRAWRARRLHSYTNFLYDRLRFLSIAECIVKHVACVGEACEHIGDIFGSRFLTTRLFILLNKLA